MSQPRIFEKPNYTQIPNLLLDDLLPYMNEAEMRVTLAIARGTFGYHREQVQLTFTELEAATRLSRQGVANGINEGLRRGTIVREAGPRNSYFYALSLDDLPAKIDPSRPEAVNLVDHGSQLSRPEAVSEVDCLTPTLKKDLKKDLKKPEKEKDRAVARSPTDWQRFVGAMCWTSYGHDKVKSLTKEQRGQLTSEAKRVRDLGYGLDELRLWFRDVWMRDWRWEKHQQRPTPAQVRSSIPCITAEAPDGFTGPAQKQTAGGDAVDRVFAKLEETGAYHDQYSQHFETAI